MTQAVAHESWFERIGSSIKGVLFGLVLFALAFPVLFLNEGRAVNTSRAIKEGASSVISTTADDVDPADDGQFIHLTGLATTDAVLNDEFFGVSVNAIRFERRVEMLQWKEIKDTSTRKKIGGGTETVATYRYQKEWASDLVNSQRFHESTSHQNPTDIPFKGLVQEASSVSVGAYRLPKSLIQRITNAEPLDVSLDNVQKEWAEGLREYSDGASGTNGFYWSRSGNAAPEIGDVRILFTATKPTEVSIMARQTRDTFTPYVAKNGRELSLLAIGVASADEMFATAAVQNSIWTWILRVVGGVLMFAGISLVLQPLSVLADVLPPVGAIVEMGAGLVGLVVAVALSSLTISFAWLFYRPLIGLPLLAIGVGLIALMIMRFAKQASNAQEPQTFVDRPYNGGQQRSHSDETSIGI